jgi:hypothetical protein
LIVVRLMGGLGNQMFQLAAGRRLAADHGVELVLDLGWFAHEGRGATARRHYALDCFDTPFRTVSLSERRVRSLERGGPRLVGALRPATSHLRVLREGEPATTPAIETASDDTLLVGYWQSERYFAPIADEIRRRFTFPGTPAARADEIMHAESLGVHVRRTDYVHDPDTNAVHGVLDAHYYTSAVARVAAQTHVDRIFVFSDDPEWARANLHFDHRTSFVSEPGHRDWEEMWLLSLCRHQVIANSSFSWWAAWLNPSPNKIVIAPQSWFRDGLNRAQNPVPHSWERL